MYIMSLQTLQALEELQRRQFCTTCLIDLKEDGFSADPEDSKQVGELIGISSRLEAQGLASESIQYRYFMLFYIMGSPFLQNKGIHYHLFDLKTEEERLEYLEELIEVNLQVQQKVVT